MTTTRCVPALLLLTLLTAAPAQAQGETPPPSAETVQQVLDAEALRLMATLPIQESGRVKPLDTVASFKLLKLRGARAAYTPAPNKRKLTPIEWFTHCLLYPELARTYEVFVIQDSAVLELIGFEVDDKRKRDRYSYDELEPARQRLYEAFAPLQGLRREQLDRLQTQLVDLHSSVLEFELLIHHLDFARYDIASGIHPMVQALFQRENGQPGPARVPFSRLVAEGPRVVSAVRRLSEGDVPPGLEGMRDSGLDAFQQVVQVVQGLGLRSAGLTLIPPTEEDAEAWLSPDDVGKIAFSLDPHVHQEEIALLQRWEALVASRSDPVAFKSVLRGLHDALSGQAAARGEYDKIELEVNFYRWDFFYKALLFFLFGFLAIAFSWLQKPGTRTDKALVFTASSLTGIGLGFSVAGIVFRCILRERPPVSTLYETILFITACAVLTALAMEWINRQRVGLALAPTLGAAGMFFAGRYEMHEAVDTMPQLQAVLDTNFWLATHVTTVTLGYAAGLLAGVMGHVYLIARMFKFKGGDRTWFRGLSR